MTFAKLIEHVRMGADFGVPGDDAFRTEALAALLRVEGLRRELEDTEAWLRGRAGILRQAAAVKDNAPILRAEAARFEGRAALVRQALIEFKE